MAQKGERKVENHGEVKGLSEIRGNLSWSMMKRGRKIMGVVAVSGPSPSSQLYWKA